MPRASRIQLKKSLEKELRNYFTSLIVSLNSQRDIDGFIRDFLTMEEKVMLLKRLALHMMLDYGCDLSQITSVLGISKETVRIHRAILEKAGEDYRHLIKTMTKKEKIKMFLQKIEKIFRPLDLAMRAKSDMKARAKFASGNWDEN